MVITRDAVTVRGKSQGQRSSGRRPGLVDTVRCPRERHETNNDRRRQVWRRKQAAGRPVSGAQRGSDEEAETDADREVPGRGRQSPDSARGPHSGRR